MDQQNEFGSAAAASLGGKARAMQMSAEQKSESARIAAEARWKKAGKPPSVHRATHVGTLKLGDIELPCAVLEDGTRLISERGLLGGLGIKYGGALSRSRESEDGAGRLPLFVGYKNLRPFVDNELAALLQNPIEYRAIHVVRQSATNWREDERAEILAMIEAGHPILNTIGTGNRFMRRPYPCRWRVGKEAFRMAVLFPFAIALLQTIRDPRRRAG